MSDPFEPEPNLKHVANKGALLVAFITKYLSTLPHPIEDVEELVSLCSVISSLLQTLHATIGRFHSTTQLCPKTSFIKPLCNDILSTFNQLGQKLSEARSRKLFEPNDVGLVRVPHNAWIFVMGGEHKLAQLRNRMYVEKYRVRVLIDVVTWQGLRELGPLGRTTEQERELENLKRMLPLLAERLMGVWKDYQLRLGNGVAAVAKEAVPVMSQAVLQKETPVVVSVREIPVELNEKTNVGGKIGVHDSPSTTSVASTNSATSTTASASRVHDFIQERWVLRLSDGARTLCYQTNILGVPFRKTYKHVDAYYYVQPLASHVSEIEDLVAQQIRSGCSLHKDILNLPNAAQREIQRLLERRQNASSNDDVKRSFEVVAFQSRPRRSISPCNVAGTKSWWKLPTKGPEEWVIAIKGQTVDRLPRTTPVKGEDPWIPKPNATPQVATPAPMPQRTAANGQQAATFAQAQNVIRTAPGAHVLRHVEQRKEMSYEEAEAKTLDLLEDLMKYKNKKGVNSKIGSETTVEVSKNEDNKSAHLA